VLILPYVFVCSEFAFEAPHERIQLFLHGNRLRFRFHREVLRLIASIDHLGAWVEEILLFFVWSYLGAVHLRVGGLSHLTLFLNAVMHVSDDPFLSEARIGLSPMTATVVVARLLLGHYSSLATSIETCSCCCHRRP